ncbi:MAG: cobalamin biosynthesis protein CbiM [Candidatus Fervidibacterota bacterium]
MHIPDGFLSTPVWMVTDAAAVVAVGFALKRVSGKLEERQVPLMGVMAAFVFGAQMLNFPIVGGTSGHVLGGLLTALLLGPETSVIVLTVVLIVQAFLFGDGGILALGANILNMAVIGTWLSYGIYRWLASHWERGRRHGTGNKGAEVVAIALAAWLSVVLSAVACALELALSGTAPLTAIMPLMAGIHAIIGVGEALVTVAAVNFVKRMRPELVRGGRG